MVDKVLIDGDVLVYKAAWACQKTHYTHIPTGEFFDGKRKAMEWNKKNFDLKELVEEDWEIEEVLEPWSECAEIISTSIQDIVSETKAEDYTVYLSPKLCFRHDIATVSPYKDRKQPKPKHYTKAREYMVNTFGAEVPDNLEADDALGMAQTTKTVIATVDKDLNMIAGKHYNFDTKKKFVVSPDHADRWFLFQLITGDSVDSIKGLPGCGPTFARKLVNSYEGDNFGLLEEIKALYEDHYDNGEEVMKEMAALLWILRRGETPETAGWRGLLGL